VELITLPEAPEMLLGLINMRGKIIPVVNIRRQFRLPEREIELSDRIILCRIASHTVAFVADSVEGIVTFPRHQLDRGGEIFPEMENYIEGVGKINGNTVIIYNIRKFFSDREMTAISLSENRDAAI
jgi:purine-binding chemotaxis protein CheW